jgi:hypothetical protein
MVRSRFRTLAAVAGLVAGPCFVSLSAQTITLQIKPHAGDTLRMRLDQESEMTGVRRSTNGESTAMLLTTMRMFSRAIVEGGSEKSTTVLAVTDSVILSTSDEHTRSAAAAIGTQMRGQRIRFNVAPDGMVSMMSSDDGTPREVAQVVSLMPATFPRGPIKVGESWVREMPLPAGAQLGAQLSGKLHVTFRLDSLTHGGEWAYVSMRGELQPATGPGAAGMDDRGTVNGTMLVDQKRGWLTESWFNIIFNSVQSLPPSAGVLSLKMMTRITQHMHTFERR